MRYPPTHKAESRAKLLEAARVLFRREGFERPTVDQITGAAGLTRGTFYAHFRSKAALVEAVMAIEAGLIAEVLSEEEGGGLSALLAYLQPENRADVAANCPLVSHPVDAARGPVSHREAYQQQLFGLVGAVETQGPGADAALEMVIAAVGSALLSAAVADSTLADAIEAAGARLLTRSAGPSLTA